MNVLLSVIIIVFIFLPINYASEFCNPIPLNKISINAHCEYQNKTISCERPIPAKARVTISCKIGYVKPARSLPDVILCDDSGEWNTYPWKCDQGCGYLSPDLLNGEITNILRIPWHVAVYSHVGEEYRYLCGGSIISSRIVLSAAHCFWDENNSRIGVTSKYVIAAGKTLNHRNAVKETEPNFFDILEIKTNEHYRLEKGFNYQDIAVIILSEYINFTEYITPVCVEFNFRDGRTNISSEMIGKLPVWSLTELDDSRNEVLRTEELSSVDFSTCLLNTNISLYSYIISDKFCAEVLDSTSACHGYNGGGLVFNKPINGVDTYYLYGIVSLGPSQLGSCDNTKYSLFTNITYFLNMIFDSYLDKLLQNEIFVSLPLNRSCYTPEIPENGRIVYAVDINHELRAGEVIMLGSAIKYLCYSKFILIGEVTDVCFRGRWSYPTPKCSKYCDPIPLNKISINAHCEYQGKTISCERPIPPKTRVTISCKIGYDKPARSLPDVISCDESGEWNTHPWKCDQTCGIPSPELIPYIVNGVVTEIRKVPWHVAIYSHIGEEYSYLCGGSIISSRIILSAAHCFWDGINFRIGVASKYAIGAGKSLNDRHALEETGPQFIDVSEIKTKEQYQLQEGFNYQDIAVIILSEYIIFTEYISPVCVNFNFRDSRTNISSELIGKLPVWPLTELGDSTNEVLRTVELSSVDFSTCLLNTNISLYSYITSDKFCAEVLDSTSACHGYNGGGLVFNKPINGVDTFYLYGIVSLGPSQLGSCDNTKYSLFTNVNFYLNMILDSYLDHYLHNEEIITRSQNRSCNTPVIPKNGRVVYSHDNNQELRSGQMIMMGSAIEYKCYRQFTLIGEGGDTCIDGEWSYPTPKCRKYCDPIPLNKISINAHCEYQGKTISCERPIPPKTRVTISCKIGYDKPARSLPDVISCDDSGEWNTHPWKCDQTCGIPSPELIPYIVNGVVTEIRKVPWHVAIYFHIGEEYSYLCGGSIISSKIVLSAAHCFWDGINSRIGEASKYAIAAGKTLNDRNAVEETVPQFFDISEIITKEQYLHEEGLYYHDIAVIILSEYIIFTEYILPVCVDFNLRDSQTYVASGMIGKLSGWGLTESGGSTSEVLRTVELPSVDYTTCVAHSNVSFRKYITSDKFCAGLLDGTSACQGDSGGGLVFNKPENGIDKYYVYGIVSLGPSSKGSCDNTKYSLFTNVNYYINMILDPYFQYLNNV